MKTYIYFSLLFISINIISYITMYYDKKRAINHKSRISEKTLFTLALLLGGIGIYAGMFKFRHKTKHTKFLIGIPIAIILNIITIYLLFKIGFQ